MDLHQGFRGNCREALIFSHLTQGAWYNHPCPLLKKGDKIPAFMRAGAWWPGKESEAVEDTISSKFWPGG